MQDIVLLKEWYLGLENLFFHGGFLTPPPLKSMENLGEVN